jgi:hypothetical protein
VNMKNVLELILKDSSNALKHQYGNISSVQML